MKYFIDSNIFIYAAAGLQESIDILSEAVSINWSGYSTITRIEVIGYKQFNKDEEIKLLRMLSCFHE
jgi:predicted nucleic acid-binding protein